MQELSIFMVWLQGLLSFFSPCVLPMVPVYLSYLAGQQVQAGLEKNVQIKLVRNAAMFVLGFTLVFVLLGATATALGAFFMQHAKLLRIISGCVIMVFGFLYLDIVHVPFLQRQRKLSMRIRSLGSLWGSLLMGIFFCAGWTPCVGPILSSVMLLAANTRTVWKGMGLLLTYALGMGIPFMLLAVFVRVMKKPLAFLNRHVRLVRLVCGLLLMFMGFMLLMNWFAPLSALVL